jgi:hypothetical protein
MIKPLVPVINWNNPITKGLIFDAPLFEGGKTNVLDIVTKVNGVFGSAPTWIKDSMGMTLKFNGSSDFVEFPSRASLSTNVFTIVALVNTTTASTTQFILGSDVGNGIGFRITSAGVLDFIQTNIAVVGTSTGTIPANVFNLVAITYDASGNFNFYNNGVNIGSGTNVKTWSASKIQLGVERVSTPNFFNGKMAFVKVWNCALSAQAIKKLYTDPWQLYQAPNFYNPLDSFGVSPSASQSPSASRSPSASVSLSQSPSSSISPSASISLSPSPSASESRSASASVSPSGSVSLSQSPSASASLSQSPSASGSPSSSVSLSRSPSSSNSPSVSPSPSPEITNNAPLYLELTKELSMMIGRQKVAYWNTLGRPSSPVRGAMGYNTDLDQIEIYNGSGWKKIALTDV